MGSYNPLQVEISLLYMQQESVRPSNNPMTTAYVGKISPGIEEHFLMSLFKTCGDVKSWKPMLDPETKKPKGFGFVDFVNPDGVLRAIRVLSGLEIDGSSLILKVNDV